MQITITQDELEIAVRDYIASQGIDRPIQTINFTQTRGSNSQGIVTEIEFEMLRSANAPSRPAPSKPRAVELTSPEEATPEEATEAQEEVDAGDATEAEAPAGKSLFG